jgi:hypothetical protein
MTSSLSFDVHWTRRRGMWSPRCGMRGAVSRFPTLPIVTAEQVAHPVVLCHRKRSCE